MRFPDFPSMYRALDLFKNRLEISDKIIPYYISDLDGNEIIEYNTIRRIRKDIQREPNKDWFNDCVGNGGMVPPSFMSKGLIYWLELTIHPFREAFNRDWQEGLALLWKYKHLTVRAFMASKIDDGYIKKDAYPDAGISWLEKMFMGIGMFHIPFTESFFMMVEIINPGSPFGHQPRSQDWSMYCLAYVRLATIYSLVF